MKAFKELNRKEINEATKQAKLLLKESYTSTGKIRAIVLTVDGLPTAVKNVLQASKKEQAIYKALDRVCWYNQKGYSNGVELINSIKGLYNDICLFSKGLLNAEQLQQGADVIASTRLVNEINKAQKQLAKFIAEYAKFIELGNISPLYAELGILDKAKSAVEKAQSKLDWLNTIEI